MVPGKFWEEEVHSQIIAGLEFPVFNLRPTRSAFVTLTFPNNRVYKFRPVVTPANQFGAPLQYITINYEPETGTEGKLIPLTDSGNEMGASGILVSGTPPAHPNGNPGGYNVAPVTLTDLDTSLVFNPKKFKFIDPSGTEYLLDETGITKVTDTNNNSITFSSNGIQHSSGKSITFTRDVSNRIISITDPNGNVLKYEYNASGDLVNFINRESEKTSFTYTNHYLLTIQDPTGKQPIRNNYDGTGRLVSSTDAFGKIISYTHDIKGKQEIVKDRLSNQTLFVYDENGNVLQKTDADGNQTSFTYDTKTMF